MKKLKLGITALALTIGAAAFSQTTSNPWLIGIGMHGVNHASVGANDGYFNMAFSDETFDFENYSIVPPLSKLTIARNLNKAFVIDWQTSLGNVENKRFPQNGDQFMFMTGLGLQYKLNSLWNENSWFDPFLRLGANYLRMDYTGMSFPATDVNGNVYTAYDEHGNSGNANHFTLAPGIGANLWLGNNFGIGLQGDYVGTPADRSDIANFFQGSASLMFRFGAPKAPEVIDTDGDGLLDDVDACPEVAGPAENNGCPWPDTDGDGVIDRDDKCVTVAGPAENFGCPWPDADGDGILDKDDACPTVPGLPEYKGCPKPMEAFATETEKVLSDILFNFDKATIRPESGPKLDAAADIIKDSNGGTFLLIGHTDKKGSAAYNLNLSRRRAASVVAALEARGVSGTQLKSKGVGEAEATVPETASDAERLVDRKVQVKYVTGAEWDATSKSDVGTK